MPTTRTAQPSTGTGSRPGSARQRRRGVVVPWDFRASGRMAREHLRVLELAFETLARQWTTQMVTRLRADVSVELRTVDQCTYDEHASTLAVPSPLVVLGTDIGAAGLLHVPSEVVLSVVDHGLGGPGRQQEARELTELEVGVLRDLGDKVIAALDYAFATITPLGTRRTATEQIPQLAQAAQATDQVVVARFGMTVGATTGEATLALVLAPLQARLGSSAAPSERSAEELEAEARAQAAVVGAMPKVPVDVALRLTPTRVTSDRVLDLAVGDVVPLGHPTSRPLEVVVAGLVVARAVPTASSTRLACMVVSTEESPR
ncbi:flagellar motor switch protein FliM [uncultured Pseudokineococcus sp.]|uniref:flagellar motor switch protein FliM n=1 Tax=uncultured Pseudokineococcus sp. TaxID=1642928 RepID=UPI00263682C3|nr:flagellar motor switch protein FliM [uncultured Pseudokineococcus sp.]